MNDQKKTSPEFDTDKDLSADEAKPATADQDTDAKDSAASVSSDGAETLTLTPPSLRKRMSFQRPPSKPKSKKAPR
ncbi:hypothetical protein AUC71_07375 [Methyloceanibacter marginalis]|uniref:Uncharacterized protein n=1 Tax=Methyloceanibacter marginalis TaxID=1774971 RepID=A0A1E3WDF3_9HYPH|nr:hypothetical protein [Methyloceanibacter marginalis]ODS03854.1 hypothetical protein AUC71_07375 [Methyloceanibacter marginalis]